MRRTRKNSTQSSIHPLGCGDSPMVLFTENPNMPPLASATSGSATCINAGG